MPSAKHDDLPTPGEALEAALAANPDDLAAHNAYADWLMEQGDPRGEFIQVQLALEDEKRPAKERKKLQKREAELLEKHQRTWLGELAEILLEKDAAEDWFPPNQFRFTRGWFSRLRVELLTWRRAKSLAEFPTARLLRELIIGSVEAYLFGVEDEEPEDAPNTLGLLAKSPCLQSLRVLELGGRHALEDTSENYLYSSGPAMFYGGIDLIERQPLLEELYVQGDISGVDQLFGLKTLPRLQILQLVHGDAYPLPVLARNPAWKNLNSLLLHPEAADEGGDPLIDLAGVRALLRSRHLEKLTHLRIHQTDIGDAGCAEIVRSGILKRLKVLDLGFGCVTDAGAGILAACPDLRNLELLDLYRNSLTDVGIRSLQATGVRIRADEQHDPDDREYLYEGDME